MKKKLLLTILLLKFTCASMAQPSTINIPAYLHMPGDSITQLQFVSSLNDFWKLKDSSDISNPFIYKKDFLATSTLLDEVRGIQASQIYKDEHFYKPYLINVVPLPNNTFIVQLAVIGISKDQAVLRAIFNLGACKTPEGYKFYSLLSDNTSTWKIKSIGGFTFHYKTAFLPKNVPEYVRAAARFDKKLGAVNQKTEIFLADNFPEVLKLVGVDFKSDYNGYAFSSLSSHEPGKTLVVTGEDSSSQLDMHDLWHERLHNVYPISEINKPIDEGCAYLYGGSWGISWGVILKMFKRMVVKPGADYLSFYESFYNFGESPQKHLIAGYVMNALIVQKLERDKGFSAVIEFLTCGKYEKSNNNYFTALERLTGINRTNFNQRIAELIKNS